MGDQASINQARDLLTLYARMEQTDETERTPERFLTMLAELTTREPFTFTTFESEHDEMITVGPVDFYSLCSHHVIPFMGKAWIGYIPQGRIAGLSKLPRTVKYLMRGLWNQEDLTNEIANMLDDNLKPKGTAVVLKAEHLCMTIRGVQSPGTITTTSVMRGAFADHTRLARTEFLEFIHNGH